MSDLGQPGGAGESGRSAGDLDWRGYEDLTAVSEEDLRELLEKLVVEEREISYRRRVLQGRIDLLRAELVRRGGVTIPPEELARVLMGEVQPDPHEEGQTS